MLMTAYWYLINPLACWPFPDAAKTNCLFANDHDGQMSM